MGCHCLLWILCIENPKISTQDLLELRNEFSKITGYKLIYRNLLFFTLIIKCLKEEVKKILFKIASKEKIPKNKLKPRR